MSANKYRPHVCVVPEDEADHALAVGFRQHPSIRYRNLDIANPAGGWRRVLDFYASEYVPHLRTYPLAQVVLLIDFDEQGESRRAHFNDQIPVDLRDRTFLIGSRSNPETLRRELKRGFESIGTDLAAECDHEEFGLWNHDELRDNLPELRRLLPVVRPIIHGA